jgi:hypothetical protein
MKELCSKIKIIFFLAIVLFVSVSYPITNKNFLHNNLVEDTTKSNNQTIKLSSILAKTVIFLYENKGMKDSSHVFVGNILGTAFIVGIPLPNNPKESIPLIVTAKHVIADRKSVLGRYNTKSGDSPFYVTYNFDSLKKSNDYWEYPDDNGVDLVVFRTLVYENVDFESIPINIIATKEIYRTEQIDGGDRIVIPCLMSNYPGVTKNYPIFRDGSIALISEEPVEFSWKLGEQQIKTSQSLIFVNSTLNEGFSGAPVFLWPGPRLTTQGTKFGGNPWLLGIVHGFFPNYRNVIDSEGNQVVIIKLKPGILGQLEIPKELKVFSQENPGTGIVFPSWKLLDILNSNVIKLLVIELSKKEN